MKYLNIVLPLLGIIFMGMPAAGQKKGIESISDQDLRRHMNFLASDELEGRASGEPGLLVAARYLAVQAEDIGLISADPENGYLQKYIIEENAYDWENCSLQISEKDGTTLKNSEEFYVLPPIRGSRMEISGELVFAGYGIKDETFDYNDFEGIDIKDKIVMILNRAPMNEEGTDSQFGNKWLGLENVDMKIQNIVIQQPKALLLVFDPKSGMNSINDLSPMVGEYLSSSKSLKKEEVQKADGPEGFKIIIIHRSVADQILEGTGKNLAELQSLIDSNLEPQSFEIEGKEVSIQLKMKKDDILVPNVFGYIEGSDPLLKEEMVIYLAHFDHMGTDGIGGVYNGADDNASGSVALLEIAQAFMKDKKRPKRSVGFLWVSAEEIGLFGSSYFADHPLVPIEKIVTVINLDMVARSVSAEDITAGRKGITIVGKDSVKVIGAKQSTVLMEINQKTLDEMGLHANYRYNDINHPDRYYFRSDHINFARKDIPVLFYSTGTHTDYHEITDEIARIDFEKFLRMARFSYKVGFNVANYSKKISVDNPMSKW